MLKIQSANNLTQKYCLDESKIKGNLISYYDEHFKDSKGTGWIIGGIESGPSSRQSTPPASPKTKYRSLIKKQTNTSGELSNLIAPKLLASKNTSFNFHAFDAFFPSKEPTPSNSFTGLASLFKCESFETLDSISCTDSKSSYTPLPDAIVSNPIPIPKPEPVKSSRRLIHF